MISDDGFVWLTGISPNEVINISWGAKQQCKAKVPNEINSRNKMLLLCEQ